MKDLPRHTKRNVILFVLFAPFVTALIAQARRPSAPAAVDAPAPRQTDPVILDLARRADAVYCDGPEIVTASVKRSCAALAAGGHEVDPLAVFRRAVEAGEDVKRRQGASFRRFRVGHYLFTYSSMRESGWSHERAAGWIVKAGKVDHGASCDGL